MNTKKNQMRKKRKKKLNQILNKKQTNKKIQQLINQEKF